MRTSRRHTRALAALCGLAVAITAGPLRGAPAAEPRAPAPGRSADVPGAPGRNAALHAPDAPAPGGPPAPGDVDEQLARARELARGGDWRGAADALRPVEDDLPPAGVLELATALARCGDPRAEQVLARGVGRFPADGRLRVAWVDAALARQRYAEALERIRRAPGGLAQLPEMHFRAAQACFRLGRVAGDLELRAVPGGRAGQFAGDWLLIERRGAGDVFLCCPAGAALYQLRRALDAGLDEPAAHVLHARIWQQLRHPELALAILKSREALLLEEPGDEVLATCCDVALEAGALADYLRYARLRADRQPGRRDAVLLEACLTAAERYRRQGDEVLYIAWLYRALRIGPQRTDVLLRLADAEWARGRRAAAADLYWRLLRLDSRHPDRQRIVDRLASLEDGGPGP